MASAAWLVLRLDGCLFGVAAGAVRRIEAGEEHVWIRLERYVLQADDVVGLCRAHAVRQLGRVGRRMLPAGSRELALSEHGPVVLIDEASPPEILIAGGARDGEAPGRGDPAGRASSEGAEAT
jgi:hypothetical protein